MSLLDVGRRRRRWIDPNGGGRWRRGGHARGEALGMRGVRGGEDEGSRGDALIGEAVVDVVRGQQADAAVTVLVVVPVEEWAAVGTAVLCGSEALGKVGPVLCAILVVVASVSVEADASLIGFVTTHASSCLGSTGSHAYCGFVPMPPTAYGYNVSEIYIDGSVASGSPLTARACDQSWSGSSLACSSWSTSGSTTGPVDLAIAGFAWITGSTGSKWDYYYAEIIWTGAGTSDLWGVSFQ